MKYFKLFAGVALVGVLLTTASGCKKFLDRKPLSATLDDYGSVVDGQIIGMYSVFHLSLIHI